MAWLLEQLFEVMDIMLCREEGVTQGLKKCKFPRKLVEISHGLQVEDDRPFMKPQKEFVFLKRCTQEP